MKAFTWFLFLGFSSSAFADPSVIINNYAGQEASRAAAPAVSVAQPASPPAAEENESNGFYLGILGGITKGSGDTLVLAGLAPKLRFGRFFALEGTVRGAVPEHSFGEAALLSASAHLTAQLTFRSALLDFTPKIGVGYSGHHVGGSSFSGLTGLYGVEVELGQLAFSLEAVAGSSSSRERVYSAQSVVIADPSPPLYGDAYYYPIDTEPYYGTESRQGYARVDVTAAVKLGSKDRCGVQYSKSTLNGTPTEERKRSKWSRVGTGPKWAPIPCT